MFRGFEYFLNAIHYCLWLIDRNFGNYIGNIVSILLSPIPKLFFTKEYQKKCEERLKQSQNDYDRIFYNKETGFHISRTHHLFGYFYSCYPGYLSLVLLGIYFRSCDELNFIIFWILIGLPIALGYIPAYKAVFVKNNYFKYFKKFEKEDEHWHKKWKRITIVFCIGSMLSTLLGILTAWGILLF